MVRVQMPLRASHERFQIHVEHGKLKKGKLRAERQGS
jgi:hypothetical protein